MPSHALGISEGVYLDRTANEIYFTSGRKTSSGQLVASTVAKYDTVGNDTLVLNGRVLYGYDDLNEIASEVNAAFVEANGMARGSRNADKVLSSLLASRAYLGTSDHTAAFEVKAANRVPYPEKAHKFETPQEIYLRLRQQNPEDPVFFRGEEKMGQALVWLQNIADSLGDPGQKAMTFSSCPA